ncbi:MAG TPA: NYN domain-containing protein [Gemmatimonadota bacterium]|nr:NYN domain-containing protein [Gemmatimonadota bacterium]
MNDAFTRAPHRRTPVVEHATPHAALMIDFDNVTMGIRSNLGQELRNLLDSDIIRGKVSVQRAYADWRRYPQYIVPLSEASIDLIFAPAYGSSKKNATDIRLAIDALEIVFTRPEIGTFILLSGDSDFSSLVLKLKEYGKYVIGVGMQESSSDLLVQNCDEYYSYNRLSGLTAASESTTETFDPWVLAARTIQRMVERGDVMRSDRFKQVMLEFDPSFSEKSLGFSKFNRFLSEAASRGIVDLHKAANGQYEVAPGSHAEKLSHGGGQAAAGSGSGGGGSSSARSGRSRSRSDSSSRSRSRSGSKSDSNSSSRSSSRRRDGSGGRSSDASERREAAPSDQPSPEVDEDRLRTAYNLLRDVVQDLSDVGQPVRDSEIKRQMLKRDEKFDEGALGFRKFSRFLRQAHDEEIINLETGPEGNYLVSPLNGASSDRSAPAREAESRPEPRRQAEPKAQQEPKAERESEAEPERKAEPEPRAEAKAEDTTQRAADTQQAADTSAEADEPRTTRGLGRFRRGSRGRSTPAPSAKSESPTIPGPVDTGASSEATPSASSTAPSAVPARSVTGRGSSREPARPVKTGTSAPSTSSKSSDVSDDFKAEIEEMSRAYPGVGRRTAERLYAEFGADLLDVIDEQPHKINSILPEHRARAVIEGREAQREANGD